MRCESPLGQIDRWLSFVWIRLVNEMAGVSALSAVRTPFETHFCIKTTQMVLA